MHSKFDTPWAIGSCLDQVSAQLSNMDVKIRPAQLFIFNNVPSTKSDVWGFFVSS